MILNFTSFEKQRLDDFLRKNLPGAVDEPNVSNSKIRRLIVAGAVSVNKAQVRRPAFELRGISHVEVNYEKEKFLFEKQPDDVKFELSEKNILFEDEFIICVDKPALFPTEETLAGGEKRDSLHAAVVRYLWKKNPSLRNPPYAGIMHRLDRETSGVILFTKQRSVNKEIQRMFAEHDFIKNYLALCTDDTGKLGPGKEFSVEMFMNRISPKSHAAKWGSVSESSGGLYSRTDFCVLKEVFYGDKKFFLVRANLFTGRTHQIRVHLSYSGFPILGDVLYGGKPEKRVMLHSSRLEFRHPVSGKLICVQSETPFC